VRDLPALARRLPPRVAAGGALVLAVAGGYELRRCVTSPDATDSVEANLLAAYPPLPWCAEGLESIAGEGCYAAPRDAPARGPLPLLIYLHGLFEKGALEDEERDRQRRVARKATERGFALLALRGQEGACTSDPERSNLVCWPSNQRTADKATAFVARWGPALEIATRRHPPTEKYVLGFSNGGYFAGLVAEKALYRADAFAIAHAGPVEPVKAVGDKVPLLLLSADDDLSQEGMVRLDDELTRDGWPHAHYVREGGHALPDSDIDAALTFFDRTRTERLPFHPPLSTRIPRARAQRLRPDASAALVTVLEGDATAGNDGEASAGQPSVALETPAPDGAAPAASP
jgi:dienelactone hydrolase